MKTGLKILSAVTSLGAVGGAGFVAHHFLSDNSIGKLLKDKGHKLLSFDITNTRDKATWDPIVKAYASSGKKINNLTITITPESSTPTQEQVNSLKQECKKVINLNKYDEATLKNAEQFCVTPIMVKDLIGKSRTVLNTESSTDSTPELWNNKVTNYFKDGAKNKITGATLTQLDNSNEKSNRDKLKADCKKLEAKNNYDPDFHDSYAQFEEWCSIPK